MPDTAPCPVYLSTATLKAVLKALQDQLRPYGVEAPSYAPHGTLAGHPIALDESLAFGKAEVRPCAGGPYVGDVPNRPQRMISALRLTSEPA